VKAGRWLGVSGNYNLGVRCCLGEWVALLSDDQIVSPGWWEYMVYFVEANSHFPLGMVGWSVIFAEDLVRHGVLASREEFYTRRDWQGGVHMGMDYESKWGCVTRPRFRGHSSGSAFALKRELWVEMGGFYEEIYQPDEDFGDWVWNSTDCWCVQVPTPPIFHYGGGSSFGEHVNDPVYAECAANWAKRPHGVGETFEERGRKAAARIEATPTPAFVWLPLKYACYRRHRSW